MKDKMVKLRGPNGTTKEITLDQDEYIKGSRTIAHPDLTGKPTDSLCVPDLHMLFWSVLGAINFAILTRMDIAVFVGALQRVSHKPTILHCKRLNAVVRWAQRNPKRIKYGSLDSTRRAQGTTIPTHLRM